MGSEPRPPEHPAGLIKRKTILISNFQGVLYDDKERNMMNFYAQGFVLRRILYCTAESLVTRTTLFTTKSS